MTDNLQLAIEAAENIETAFQHFQDRFREITCQARPLFETRRWKSIRRNMAVRIGVYSLFVNQTVEDLQTLLGDSCKDYDVWREMKRHYSQGVATNNDLELAETFFNSVTRRIFVTVGVNPEIEYVFTDFKMPSLGVGQPVYKTYRGETTLTALIEQILADYAFEVPYQDHQRDAQMVAERIEDYIQTIFLSYPIEAFDVVESVFFRNQGAYIVGRIRAGTTIIPVVLALRNPETGVVVDAVLLEEDEISVIFSFTRSYFQVNTKQPYALVNFLKSIMPLKPMAELYTAIGYNKHGKTELYRDLINHLATTTDKFEIARGAKGMVMTVFTMPSYDVVFKIIKDVFDYPKKTTHQQVKERYAMVFKHDRIGRLVDAQEFEHLTFRRDLFGDDLLAELQQVAANSVTIDDETVSIKHLYTERRLIPLDIYVKEANRELATQAIIDCGNTIKDLAATNIFPGDFLLKNFGVTRHNRVVFYDYDELTLLTTCNFRKIPRARDDDMEFASDPWFFVDENDIFPEEFEIFLGVPSYLRDAFAQHHQDIFGVKFWRDVKEKHLTGEDIEIFPYSESRRFTN